MRDAVRISRNGKRRRVIMKWTEKQAAAINNRGKNLMVAAAAGSGKTAVLVERIKQLIISEGCPIDRMLVVTFTNAAASEMKTKIETAIISEISRLSETKNSEDNEDCESVKIVGNGKNRENTKTIVHLKKQLDLLPFANISTFHAFAMEVIRKYFHIPDLEPDFKICDEARRSILFAKAMDELMASEYEKSEPEFYKFLDKFSGDRNDDNVRSMIASVYGRMEALPEPYLWLKKSVDFSAIDEEGFKASSVMASFLDMAAAAVKDSLDNLISAAELIDGEALGIAAELYKADRAQISAVLEAFRSGDFEQAGTAVCEFRLKRLDSAAFNPKKNPTVDEIRLGEIKAVYSAARDGAKKVVNALKEAYFENSLEETVRNINDTYDDIAYLAKLVKKFDDIFSSMKREKGLMDFSDIEHFAYEILKDEKAANHYRERFNYIFVDEYQDSNVVQEELIKRIVRDDNLFTVGDIKQSIYHFRLAEPEIFRGRYEEYKNTDGPSEKIDLNLNFRSKSGIISFINAIFAELMEGYDEDARLYAGDEHAEKNGFSPRLYLCGSTWADSPEVDDEIKLLQKTEKEALMTVGIIKEYLGSEIFDSKQNCERKLNLRDIVILMRGIKGYGDLFYKVLMENDIPAFVDDNEGYFDTIEINTMLALLSLLDNCKQDIPLITVMRSEIFGFTVSELAEIRIAGESKKYYEALYEYSQAGADETLRDKCSASLAFIAKWQKIALLMPIEELIWELLLETGFYIAMGAMPGGALRQANLRVLVDKAFSYRMSQEEGLYGFITYIEKLRENGVRMGQAAMVSEEDETVRIMTIHHSKGLEFPMVIIAGYTRKLNYSRGSRYLSIHKDTGIGLPNVNPEESWYRKTFLQKLTANIINREEVEEEKRVLYVAMTRAKDILIMTGTVDDFDEYLVEAKYRAKSGSSYFSMTAGTIFSERSRVIFVSDEQLQKTRRIRAKNIKRALRLIEEEHGEADERTREIMSFSYPFAAEQNTKSKYSVSEINDREYEKSIPDISDISLPPTLIRKKKLNAAEIGTVMHLVFEKIDFRRAGESGYIDTLIYELTEKEFITPEEAEQIDKDKISVMVSSELGKRMAEAQRNGKLHREKPFNLLTEIDGDGVEVLVQGVIDCFFFERGEESVEHIILVDYKTTAITDGDLLKKRYERQLGIYEEALTEAYGLKVKEVYLYLTNTGEAVKIS